MATEKQLAALRAHHWPKGKSGNPGGSTKGLAARIKEVTSNGDEPIAFVLSVLRGEVPCSTKDRIIAAQWLIERGWGKSVEVSASVDLNTEAEEALAPFADLNPADVKELARRALEDVNG